MLVLASHSPRRREILSNAGIEFVCRPAAVEERREDGEDPRAHVERLARAKAMAVDAAPGEIILAADTVVVVDQHVLGKPENIEEAARMLHRLSGREHEVITGICLRIDGGSPNARATFELKPHDRSPPPFGGFHRARPTRT